MSRSLEIITVEEKIDLIRARGGKPHFPTCPTCKEEIKDLLPNSKRTVSKALCGDCLTLKHMDMKEEDTPPFSTRAVTGRLTGEEQASFDSLVHSMGQSDGITRPEPPRHVAARNTSIGFQMGREAARSLNFAVQSTIEMQEAYLQIEESRLSDEARTLILSQGVAIHSEAGHRGPATLHLRGHFNAGDRLQGIFDNALVGRRYESEQIHDAVTINTDFEESRRDSVRALGQDVTMTVVNSAGSETPLNMTDVTLSLSRTVTGRPSSQTPQPQNMRVIKSRAGSSNHRIINNNE